jgi:hypothetical protein
MNKASGQETLFDDTYLYYFLFFTNIQKKLKETKIIRDLSSKSSKFIKSKKDEKLDI